MSAPEWRPLAEAPRNKAIQMRWGDPAIARIGSLIDGQFGTRVSHVAVGPTWHGEVCALCTHNEGGFAELTAQGAQFRELPE